MASIDEEKPEPKILETLPNIEERTRTDSASVYSNDDKNGTTDNRITWRHLLMCPCALLHVYSYVFYSYVVTQYLYHRIQTDKFPSVLSNESISKCQATNESDTVKQALIDIQKQTSNLTLYMSLAMSIPAIFFDILLVSASDRYGRKIPVIITLFGTFLKTLLATLGIYFKMNTNIFILFSFIEGIAGGWCCVLALGFAYVADLTKFGNKRTIAIVLLNISLGLGLVLSGITSGYIIKGVGFLYTMVFVTVVNWINLLMISILLPESNFDKDISKTYQSLRNAYVFYVKDSSGEGNRWKYLVCISIFSLLTCFNIGRNAIDTLYQLDRPFCWNSVKIGWYSTTNNAVQVIIGLSSIRVFQIFIRDEFIGVISTVSGILSSCLEAFSFNDLTMFFVPVVGVFNLTIDPIIRSIMSNMTSADKQGALFAGMAVIQNVFTVVAELLYKIIYTNTLELFRGFVFLVIAATSFVTMILMIVLAIGNHRKKTIIITPNRLN